MKRNHRGFTLIEVIVVLVVLAIIIALAVPTVMKYIEDAEEAKYLAVARAINIEASVYTEKEIAHRQNEKFDVVIKDLEKKLSWGTYNELDKIITTDAPENYKLYCVTLSFDNRYGASGWQYDANQTNHFISKISIWYTKKGSGEKNCTVILPNKKTYFYSAKELENMEIMGQENGPELPR